jgi:hypothetical protein
MHHGWLSDTKCPSQRAARINVCAHQCVSALGTSQEPRVLCTLEQLTVARVELPVDLFHGNVSRLPNLDAGRQKGSTKNHSTSHIATRGCTQREDHRWTRQAISAPHPSPRYLRSRAAIDCLNLRLVELADVSTRPVRVRKMMVVAEIFIHLAAQYNACIHLYLRDHIEGVCVCVCV